MRAWEVGGGTGGGTDGTPPLIQSREYGSFATGVDERNVSPKRPPKTADCCCEAVAAAPQQPAEPQPPKLANGSAFAEEVGGGGALADGGAAQGLFAELDNAYDDALSKSD